MKVLFIYYQYPLYPKGSYFSEFINQMAKSLNKVFLLSCHHPQGKFKKPKNLKIFWLAKIKLPFIDELFFIIASLIKAVFSKSFCQVDLVNVIGPRGLLAGWYLKKKHKIPLVCTIELLNEEKGFKNKIIYFLSRLFLTKAPIDKYICWSKYYWQQHLKKWGIAPQKIIIIPAGINIKKYHPQTNGQKIKKKYSPKNNLIVFAKPLYFPNCQSAKLLVKAVALLKPELKVNLLLGKGPGQKKIQALANKLKVKNQLSFMPFVPFPQIPQFLASADLIVLPFVYPPTTARSLLEAMAIGKPIITTPAGEIKLKLKHKHHVFLVKNQPKQLALAIKTLLNNKSLANKLGHNARQLIIKKYSLKKIANYTFCCFNQLISKNNETNKFN